MGQTAAVSGLSLPVLPTECSKREAMAGKRGGLPAKQGLLTYKILQLEVRDHMGERNNISYIYMYRINFHKLKVLNDINTD